MIGRVWRYLLRGSDDLYLPRTWLENKARLRGYEGYTRRQLQQGSVVSDVAAMQRRAFWAQVAERQEPRGRAVGHVVRMREYQDAR